MRQNSFVPAPTPCCTHLRLVPFQIGSYHYVSGIDASSSASLAAYLNSLTYHLEEVPGWFGGTTTKGGWKIRGGAFCSFNAFARVDVRVEVKIPGGVEAYVIDLRGEKYVRMSCDRRSSRIPRRGWDADFGWREQA